MLSLVELRRVARVMQEGLLNARLRQVIQLDERALLLTLEAPDSKSNLLISVHPEFARICLVDAQATPGPPGSFCEYLRAHLLGSRLVAVDAHPGERQIHMYFQARSERFCWIYSILGARSNCYLVSASGKLLHSMRPLEETRRELKIGGDWVDPEGEVPRAGTDRWEAVTDAAYLQAIGKSYAQLEEKRRAELMVNRIKSAIRKERSFQQRKYINLEEDLEAARQAEVLRYRGELLKTVVHKVQAGDSQIWVTDYHTGERVEIPLDPKLSPVANLESYFERYRKETRREKMILQQLQELQAARCELDRIESLLTEILEKDSPTIELESLISQPVLKRLLNRYSPDRKQADKMAGKSLAAGVSARLLPRRYRTDEGLEIWVGRSDEGNDYLTTRLARGNDLFFHLDGSPGSHVILRTKGRLPPSSSSVLDACELAVHFSKLKTADTADVHVAPVKNVKKPKGAKPGLVYVRGGKIIRLRRDAKRLQAILAARLDD